MEIPDLNSNSYGNSYVKNDVGIKHKGIVQTSELMFPNICNGSIKISNVNIISVTKTVFV